MIYLNNRCTDFMFLVVMVCETYSSTISLQLARYHFCVLKFISTGFNHKICS